MTNNPLKLFASTAIAITSAGPVEFVSDTAADAQFGKGRIVRIWSNRQIHIAVGADATTDDLPISASSEGALIHVDPGEKLSAILGDGETDGKVWFSVVKRY